MRRFNRGLALGDGLLIGLVVLIIGLGGYAIFRSIDAKKRVEATFKDWYEDTQGYQQALAEQKVSHKPVLIYFYATWCPHCKQFTATVLTDGKMQNFVKDFPHVRVAPDDGQPERELMKQFGADGYPSVFIVLPNGERKKVETYTSSGNAVHEKDAEEFIASIKQAMGGQ
jgi:thiol:disulfide interchange protein